MAHLSDDTVVRIAFSSVDQADRRLIERVLADVDGVTAFNLAEDGTLVVSLRTASADEFLSRALTAAGKYPLRTELLGAAYKGGIHAC